MRSSIAARRPASHCRSLSISRFSFADSGEDLDVVFGTVEFVCCGYQWHWLVANMAMMIVSAGVGFSCVILPVVCLMSDESV